jgi:hypothetical protein
LTNQKQELPVAAMFVNGLEGEINVNEASRVLQKMNNNKSPGSDGFSTEFFKFFKHFFNRS